jgi:excisionase family DNA binding protein
MANAKESRGADNTHSPQVFTGTDSTPRYLTRKESCDLLRITLPTLRDWSIKGYLSKYKVGRSVRYRYDELIDAIENRNA